MKGVPIADEKMASSGLESRHLLWQPTHWWDAADNSDYHRLYGEDDIMEYYTSDLFIDLLQKSEWHEILSIIEYFVNDGLLSKSEVNKLLTYHNVGYEVEKQSGRAGPSSGEVHCVDQR